MVKVALTRELGNNDKLRKLLEEKNVECVEIPCIAFGSGEDLGRLSEEVTKCDIIVWI